MSVIIQFGKSYAAYREGEWMSANPQINQVLNRSLERRPVPPDHPNPDAYALKEAKLRLPSLNVIHMGPEDGQRSPSPLRRLFSRWVRERTPEAEPPPVKVQLRIVKGGLDDVD